MTILLTAVVS